MWSVWLVFCDCSFHSVCPMTNKDKRHMEASWWERLWGKLSLVLMGGAMLSRALCLGLILTRGPAQAQICSFSGWWDLSLLFSLSPYHLLFFLCPRLCLHTLEPVWSTFDYLFIFPSDFSSRILASGSSQQAHIKSIVWICWDVVKSIKPLKK